MIAARAEVDAAKLMRQAADVSGFLRDCRETDKGTFLCLDLTHLDL